LATTTVQKNTIILRDKMKPFIGGRLANLYLPKYIDRLDIFRKNNKHVDIVHLFGSVLFTGGDLNYDMKLWVILIVA
jgi:hypothetical protein